MPQDIQQTSTLMISLSDLHLESLYETIHHCAGPIIARNAAYQADVDTGIGYASNTSRVEASFRIPQLPDNSHVILLGDQMNGVIEGMRWAARNFPNCKITYVLGNHQFKKEITAEPNEHAEDFTSYKNFIDFCTAVATVISDKITVVEQRSIHLNERFDFFGAVMWGPESQYKWELGFSPEVDINSQHDIFFDSLAQLEQAIISSRENGKKLIIGTHFPITREPQITRLGQPYDGSRGVDLIRNIQRIVDVVNQMPDSEMRRNRLELCGRISGLLVEPCICAFFDGHTHEIITQDGETAIHRSIAVGRTVRDTVIQRNDNGTHTATGKPSTPQKTQTQDKGLDTSIAFALEEDKLAETHVATLPEYINRKRTKREANVISAEAGHEEIQYINNKGQLKRIIARGKTAEGHDIYLKEIWMVDGSWQQVKELDATQTIIKHDKHKPFGRLSAEEKVRVQLIAEDVTYSNLYTKLDKHANEMKNASEEQWEYLDKYGRRVVLKREAFLNGHTKTVYRGDTELSSNRVAQFGNTWFGGYYNVSEKEATLLDLLKVYFNPQTKFETKNKINDRIIRLDIIGNRNDVIDLFKKIQKQTNNMYDVGGSRFNVECSQQKCDENFNCQVLILKYWNKEHIDNKILFADILQIQKQVKPWFTNSQQFTDGVLQYCLGKLTKLEAHSCTDDPMAFDYKNTKGEKIRIRLLSDGGLSKTYLDSTMEEGVCGVDEHGYEVAIPAKIVYDRFGRVDRNKTSPKILELCDEKMQIRQLDLQAGQIRDEFCIRAQAIFEKNARLTNIETRRDNVRAAATQKRIQRRNVVL